MKNFARALPRLSLLALIAAVIGCSDNEAPAEDHTPARYDVIVNDVPQTAPYVLTAGQTSRVRLKLFNAAGDDLDDVEAEHFAGLTFNPTSLATATRLADHHFQFDVVPPAVGSGTMQVSFGHDELTDEKVFDPVTVNIMGSASPAR